MTGTVSKNDLDATEYTANIITWCLWCLISSFTSSMNLGWRITNTSNSHHLSRAFTMIYITIKVPSYIWIRLFFLWVSDCKLKYVSLFDSEVHMQEIGKLTKLEAMLGDISLDNLNYVIWFSGLHKSYQTTDTQTNLKENRSWIPNIAVPVGCLNWYMYVLGHLQAKMTSLYLIDRMKSFVPEAGI